MNDVANTTEELARAVQQTREDDRNLRDEIKDNERRLSDSKANVTMADNAIANLENQLAGWRRFREHQAALTDARARSLRAKIDEAHATEIYESNI